MSISWKHVKYFTRDEFDDPLVPGSGDLMDGITVFMADKTRRETGWKMIVHSSVGGAVDVNGKHGHVRNSYHRADMGCKAFDFHFETSKTLREQFNWLCRMGWTGIGFYPEWNNPGFHVDLRPIEETQHWVCRDGKYVYFFKIGE